VAALKSLRDVPTLLDPGSSLLGGAAGSRNGVVDAGGSAGSRGGVGDGVKTPTVAARFWIKEIPWACASNTSKGELVAMVRSSATIAKARSHKMPIATTAKTYGASGGCPNLRGQEPLKYKRQERFLCEQKWTG